MVEIAAENNSTTVFPIPMDLFKPIVEAGERFKALGALPETQGDPSRTLEAQTPENALPAPTEPAIPAGVDPEMLTDAAKTLLGISSGRSGSTEQGGPSADTSGGGAGEDD